MLTVEQREALHSLPPGYADVLRLRALGLDTSAIAAAIGVAPQCVKPLIKVASAKLAAATEQVKAA
jgi:DNA-directed RNA polymerase specialized sigma24 family protein